MAVLLTGCSMSGDTDTSAEAGIVGENAAVNEENWPKPGVQKGLAKGLALPIEPYLETYPEVVALQRAKNAVQRECMARFGFDFDPPTPGLNAPASYNGANMERRYGVTNLETAKEYGYGLPDTKGGEIVPYEPDSEAANLVFDLTVPQGKTPPKTYEGREIPKGGCRGESDRAIGSFDEGLPSKLNTQSWEKAKQDPQVLAVDQQWSSCMKAKGYDAATPLEAIEQSYAPNGDSSSQSNSMAVADVECKKSTDLVKVYFSVESRIQKASMEEHQLELNELKKKNEAVVKKAAAHR
ncbi:hypothetical protein ACFPH6_38960 [Streptomyces xiangluensis]|uniref:Lipoprotein n=1 Tax=Streptomyces xiangluensis TaxID=2665720 RepID=A0ABV8Z214_9ACTN